MDTNPEDGQSLFVLLYRWLSISRTIYFFFFLKNQECIRAMSIIPGGKASQSGMRTEGGEYKSVHSLTTHENQQVKEKMAHIQYIVVQFSSV